MIPNRSSTNRKAFQDPVASKIESLMKEEDPEAFRKDAIDFLKESGSYVNYLMTTSSCFKGPNQLVSKISSTLEKDDYYVSEVALGLFDRSIPVLKIKNNPPNPGLPVIGSDSPSVPVRSKEEADYLVRKLSEMEIPWNSTSGCDARADMSCKILANMNIPKNTIKKVIVEGNLNVFDEEGRGSSWHWHIAPMIVTNVNEERVIDPFFSKTKSLSKSDWVSKMVERNQKFILKEIGGEFTYDVASSRQVLVSTEISDYYRKMMVVQNYSSVTPDDSVLQHLLLNKAPPRLDMTTLQSFPVASASLKPSTVVPSSLKPSTVVPSSLKTVPSTPSSLNSSPTHSSKKSKNCSICTIS